MHNDRALSPSPSDRGHKSSFIVGLGIFEQNPEVQQCNNISHLDEPCDTAADLFNATTSPTSTSPAIPLPTYSQFLNNSAAVP
jgi:hypothetical protein